MIKLRNALPVIITLAIGAASAFLYGAPLPTADSISKGVIYNEPSATVAEPTEGEADLKGEETEEESPTSSADSNTASGAVEASSPSQAAGKIITQFISPYSAKYSYNNVYMKNSSGLSVSIKDELSKTLSFKIKKSTEPEVLIMHTHATETYMTEQRDYYTATDSARTTDNGKNVTHIGELVAEKLRAGGIGVIHDKTQHDYPAYTGSYSRSEVTVKEYLKKYPSIKIVLDIHRDSISVNETDRTRPIKEIDGKNAAQVMLCMGSESGAVKDHPNWRENLRLALKLQQTMEVMYPGLARPLVLASKLYNQHLTTGSLLLEVGTESNQLAEAEYSAELVGNALVSLLNTLG